MRNQVAGLLVTVLLAFASGAEAQNVCLPADELGLGKLNHIQRVAEGSDSVSIATRSAFQLPAAKASQVSLVIDERICKKVAASYYAALGKSSTGRALYVIKIGSSFVASDPTEVAGEWSIAMTLDRHYNVLVRFTG
jgi:hypothetical protein